MKTLKEEITEMIQKYGIYLFLIGMVIGALVAHNER